jgi:hypothetical protein
MLARDAREVFYVGKRESRRAGSSGSKGRGWASAVRMAYSRQLWWEGYEVRKNRGEGQGEKKTERITLGKGSGWK